MFNFYLAFCFFCLTDDLVAYWNFDETSGNLIDQHGIFDGANSGATPNVAGKINTAYDFDGSDDYINIENRIQLEDKASFSFWINVEGIIDRGVIISKRIGDFSGNNDWQINMHENKIYVYLWGTTTPVHQAEFSTEEGWKHIVVTYDSTSVKIYVNNLKVYDGMNSGNIKDSAPYTRIGDDFWNNLWDGKIDEFGIWKRALTEEEIEKLYNKGEGFAYPFSDGDNDGVLDEYDLCPDTFEGEEVNSDGCACSQIEILFRDCPENQCIGNNWVIYPDDGYDTCEAGIFEEYSCEAISSSYSSECDPKFIALEQRIEELENKTSLLEGLVDKIISFIKNLPKGLSKGFN